MSLTRREALTALGAVPLAACVTATERAGQSLSVATFNIWHDSGDWPKRLELIVSSLRATGADVIALQEVLQDSSKQLPNQAATIAAALGDYSVHFSSADAVGATKRYGNAILSRHPVIGEATVLLKPLDDYRTAVRARIDVGGQAIDVVSTHLAWQPDASAVRAEQLRHLLSWLPGDGTPRVVMGDFNAQVSDSALALMEQAGFVRAPLPTSATTTLVPGPDGDLRIIDHIYADRDQFRPGEARIIGDLPAGGMYPSDHFGVASTLRWR